MGMNELPDEKGQRVLRLIQELLADLPDGVASVETRRADDGSGTIVSLTPTNTTSAPFSVHTDDGLNLIDVSLGTYSTFELSDDSEFDSALATTRDMCLAVMAGRCEQRFGFFGIRGTIRVDDQRLYCATSYFHFRFLPKVVFYEPYCAAKPQ
jgi:hypothetical protein